MRNFQQSLLSLLFAGFIIPLDSTNNWQEFQFRNIPANEVQHSKDSLTLHINKSASPLIYKFPQPQKIKSIRAKLNLSNPTPFPLPKVTTQGEKGYDDFVFRLGLVKTGERRLNWMERQMAASWVLKMHELAPEASGIEKIHFLVATQQKKLLGKSRIHPLSEYFLEEFTTLVDEKKNLVIEKEFSQPLEVAALWISADGDDTKTRFQVVIKEIRINYK